ncbi:MAG: T9SS type A sorting domain-containing protein [bacterium]
MRMLAKGYLMVLLAVLCCCAATASAAGTLPQVGSAEPFLESLGLAKPAVGELADYELYYAWVEGVWSLSSRTTYGWDGQSRPTTVLDQDWQGGVWVNNYLSTTSYDGTGAVQTLTQDWIGGQWVNDLLSTFENDGEQRPIVIVTQDWDGGGWVNQSRSTITYETGMQMTEMLIEIWEAGAWVESSKMVYEYGGGNLSVLTTYTRDGEEWVPVYRSTYTYSAGKLTMEVSEFMFAIPPDTPEWTYSLRTTFNYEGDLVVEEVFESYSFIVPPIGWATTGHNLLSYDGQDRLSVEIYQSYAATALAWLNSSKIEYYYEPAAVRELDGYALPDQFSLAQNYPNPFNPSTQIRFALTSSAQVKLDVFDLLGRKVATLVDEILPVGTHQIDFDGTNLASGVYFYRLQTGDFEQTRKMLLIK